MWLLFLAIAAVAAIVIAGRAHSRRLDALENQAFVCFLNDSTFYRVHKGVEGQKAVNQMEQQSRVRLQNP